MSCNFHKWQLMTTPTRPRPRRGMWRPLNRMHPKPSTRVWVCQDCHAVTEAPVSRRHEIRWRGLPKPGPLETQVTIYDTLGEGSELFKITESEAR